MLILKANAIINDYGKRLKLAEHQRDDFQKRVEELSIELQNGNGENQKLQAEVTRLKASVSDQQAKIDQLTRDNSKLSGKPDHSGFRISDGSIVCLYRAY